MKLYITAIAACILSLRVSFADATVPVNQYYFIYDTGAVHNKAVHCEKYIKDHASWFSHRVEAIVNDYKQKDLTKLTSHLEQVTFREFKNSLWDCSLYIKYAGDINYFREANTNLFKLISNIELAQETAIYIDNDMDNLADSLSRIIDTILNSTRVDRP